MVKRLKALLGAAHFAPTMTVTTLTFLLANQSSDLSTALGIALTFFTGQLIVGWSNDLIDFADDQRHHRMNKPLVAGDISGRTLQAAIAVDTVALLALTFFGPLAFFYGVLHLIAVASALAYNAKLKSTPLSFLPYLVSFGLLPVIIVGATKVEIKWWMPAIGALFGVGAHFANVFKDLEEDLASGIRGLPQLLGATLSKIICAMCFGGGALILYIVSQQGVALFLVAGGGIFLLPIPRKFAFPFAMALGLAVMLIFISAIGA
jgi:4-hydroxybenzoate polyprenyltransferase